MGRNLISRSLTWEIFDESIFNYSGTVLVKWGQLGSRNWKSHSANDLRGPKQQNSLNHYDGELLLQRLTWFKPLREMDVGVC